MSVAARLFILINEIAFFIFMLIVPAVYSVWMYNNGSFPVMGTPFIWFLAGLAVYWLAIISLFGAVALMAENNKSLKTIAEILERQGSRNQPPQMPSGGQPSALPPAPRLKSEL